MIIDYRKGPKHNEERYNPSIGDRRHDISLKMQVESNVEGYKAFKR